MFASFNRSVAPNRSPSRWPRNYNYPNASFSPSRAISQGGARLGPRLGTPCGLTESSVDLRLHSSKERWVFQEPRRLD
jgi:hypothetical protein